MNKEEKEAIEILSYFEPDDLIEYAMYCNALNVIKNLIQKQEALIDKMAEYIKDLDLDESICIENTINPQLCNEELSNCKECIIEYFKKELEKC